jgi:hypothetical protein
MATEWLSNSQNHGGFQLVFRQTCDIIVSIINPAPQSDEDSFMVGVGGKSRQDMETYCHHIDHVV